MFQIKAFLDFDQLNANILRRVWKKSPKGFHSDSLPQQVFQPCNLLFFFNVQSNLSKSRIILPQKQTFFFPQQNTILEKLPSSASGMHIFENFYFFLTNLYFLKIGHLLFRAQYFRFHFGAKCVRSFFHFCKLVIIEQIDESDRDVGLSF